MLTWNTSLSMAIIFTLNKKIRLTIFVFLFANVLNASNFLGTTSFGNHVYLYTHSNIVKVDIQTMQVQMEKNIKKDTITTQALMKIGMTKDNSTGKEHVMFLKESIFEILSIGNMKDSLYVAIRFNNPKNLNLFSYCLLRYDQDLNFHEVYVIKYPPLVSFNYFPEYKELEFTDKSQLRLLYCDSSKQICHINFSFNENKKILKYDIKSRVVVKHFTTLVMFTITTHKQIVSPYIYAIKDSDWYYIRSYPLFFNASLSQYIDPLNMKQDIIEKDKMHFKGFTKSDDMILNTYNLNNILYHVVKDSVGLTAYIKTIDKGVLQKLSFKNGSSDFVIEEIMPLKNDLNYFVFANNNQNYLLYKDKKIEIVKLP